MGLGEAWAVSLPSWGLSSARIGKPPCLSKSLLLTPLRSSLAKNPYLKGLPPADPSGVRSARCTSANQRQRATASTTQHPATSRTAPPPTVARQYGQFRSYSSTEGFC